MRIFLIISFLVPLFSFGQNLGNSTRFYQDTSNYFEVYGEGFYGSNVFSNEFINKFRFGGFIDEDLKTKGLDRARDVNFFGGEANYGFHYSSPKTHLYKDWGYYAGMESSTSGGVQFTKDLYQLIFFGNQGLQGDSVQLQQTGLHQRSFRKMSFGLNKSNSMKFGLSFLTFSQEMMGMIQNGYIYTADSGAYLEMDVFGEFSRSNQNRTGYFQQAGTGIGIDFEYTIPLGDSSSIANHTADNYLVFGIKNLGIYFSDTQTQVTHLDSLFHYNGFEINSLEDLSGSIIGSTTLQDTLSIAPETKRITGLLPFEIYLYKPALQNKKLQSIYGFRYRSSSNYRPQFYFGGCLKSGDKTTLSSYISYGGYTNFQWGVALMKRYEKMDIGLNCNNIPGIFSVNQYGKALGISVSYRLP